MAGLHTAQKTCESVLVPVTPAVCECLASFAGGIVEVALKRGTTESSFGFAGAKTCITNTSCYISYSDHGMMESNACVLTFLGHCRTT